MRIAHLTADWLATGGVSSYVRLLAPAQAGDGHDVLVVHANAPLEEHLPPRLTIEAVPAAFRHEPGGDDARFIAPVRALLERFAPDLVHIHASDNFAVEDDVRRRYPTIKTMHNLWFCPAGTKYHAATGQACVHSTGAMCVPRQALLKCTMSRRPWIWWSNYQLAMRSIAHHRTWRQLIVTSPFVREQAMASGFDGDRIAVVPYFTEIPEVVEPVSSTRVLYVGRVAREKGADLVVEALAQCQGDWRGVIIGDGIDMPYVRQRVTALGLDDRFEFPGWMTGEALADQYRRAGIVVVPSRLPEPFGITGIEAMAHGRPVVAFRTGGIPSWLEDGIGGWLAQPGDATDLAKQLMRVLSNPADAVRLAALGRARAARDFSYHAHVARLAPLYDEARVH